METRTICTFLVVADLGSFTQAAKELHYAQSSISSQIQQLEKEVGFPLFDRVGNKVSLTSIGAAFRVYAEEIYTISQQISALGKSLETLPGTLCIGALESLMVSSMVDILPLYKKRYPNIDVTVKIGLAEHLTERLKRNLLDMIYISGDLNTNPELICRYKRKEELVFVANPQHMLAKKKKIPLTEFLSYPLIGMEKSGICYKRLNSLASSINAIPQYTLVVENIKALIEILRRYDGSAFIPSKTSFLVEL